MKLVHVLLDETGSMMGKLAATIEGINAYYDTITEAPDIRVALTKFDTTGYRTLHEGFVKPADATRLSKENYRPNASTNLFDAVAHVIHQTESDVDAARRFDNEVGVLIVVYTDGEENASVEQTVESLNSLIKAKESQGWTFMYLGAEKEAWMNERMFVGTMSAANVYKSRGASGTVAAMSAASASTLNWANNSIGGTTVIVTEEQQQSVTDNSV